LGSPNPWACRAARGRAESPSDRSRNNDGIDEFAALAG
jgi:hypothetical protein